MSYSPALVLLRVECLFSLSFSFLTWKVRITTTYLTASLGKSHEEMRKDFDN